ncbi:MAG: hypothetical protein IPH45_01355 [Bacteroidales bacterium]|nr:hypothetical protein [Bacteroidales bacterium]MBK7171841.1 hypothetical protein [Bacteroidales bacterium]
MKNERKKLIINYQSASPELMEAIRKKYPLGWVNHTFKVKTGADSFFFAITVDTDEASYLIKVPVKIDNKSEKDDEDFFDESTDTKESGDGVHEEEDHDQEKEEL